VYSLTLVLYIAHSGRPLVLVCWLVQADYSCLASKFAQDFDQSGQHGAVVSTFSSNALAVRAVPSYLSTFGTRDSFGYSILGGVRYERDPSSILGAAKIVFEA
jgi:hypothetical protein